MSSKHFRIAGILVLCSALSLPTIRVTAQPEEEHIDEAAMEAIYITDCQNDSYKCSEEGIVTTTTLEDITYAEIMDASVIIVDFENLYYDEYFAQNVSDQIRSGVRYYIRAEGYTANRTLIADILGFGTEVGYFAETEIETLYKRKGTFGYMVFLDDSNRLQIVRQRMEYISCENNKNDNDLSEYLMGIDLSENIKEIEEIYESAPKVTFNDEIEAIDSFLNAYDERTEKTVNKDTDKKIIPQNANFSSYEYEALYDTIYYWDLVTKDIAGGISYEKIGALTVAIYADRIYVNSAQASNSSAITSKWAYMTDIMMQPKWRKSSSYNAVNKSMTITYSTWPCGSGNATYKMVLRDYFPKIDVSGSTQVTYQVGLNFDMSTKALQPNGNISVTSTYKDIDISIPNWNVGLSTNRNMAEIKFTMKGNSKNKVKTELIDLCSGVLLWNYYNKYSCIQVNYTAVWHIYNGIYAGQDVSISNAFVYRPGNVY